jgi:hypothetical protein
LQKGEQIFLLEIFLAESGQPIICPFFHEFASGAEGTGRDVKPEPAVTFKLGLVEELIQCVLVRELRLAQAVFEDVTRLVSGERGLHVNDNAGSLVAIQVLIMDLSHNAMPPAQSDAVPGPDLIDIQLDLHAEIGAAFPYGVAEFLKTELLVFLGIGHDNEAATAPHKLVNSEIFEMAPIRQVNTCGFVAGRASKFLKQISEALPGRAPLPRFASPRRVSGDTLRGIAQPPAQADVEDCQQERGCGRRVIALIGLMAAPEIAMALPIWMPPIG